MMELGQFTGIGFAEGIEASLRRINAAAYQMADYPVREVSSPTTTPATVSPQPAQRIVVEVSLYLDGHEIARATVDDLGRLLASQMSDSLRTAGVRF